MKRNYKRRVIMKLLNSVQWGKVKAKMNEATQCSSGGIPRSLRMARKRWAGLHKFPSKVQL